MYGFASFVCVEGTLPAYVKDGADRCAPASALLGRALEAACFSVLCAHASVEKGSDDRKPVAWVIFLVEELVCMAPVELLLKPSGFLEHPLVVAESSRPVDRVFEAPKGVWASSCELTPALLAPSFAVAVGEVADVELVVRVLDQLPREVAVGVVSGELPKACGGAKANVAVVLVDALPAYLRVSRECEQGLRRACELHVEARRHC